MYLALIFSARHIRLVKYLFIFFFKYLNMSDALQVFSPLWRLSCSFLLLLLQSGQVVSGSVVQLSFQRFPSPVLCVEPAFHSLALLPFSFLLTRAHLIVAYLEIEVKMFTPCISERCLYLSYIGTYWSYIRLAGIEFQGNDHVSSEF